MYTKLDLLFVYDLEIAIIVYQNLFCKVCTLISLFSSSLQLAMLRCCTMSLHIVRLEHDVP